MKSLNAKNLIIAIVFLLLIAIMGAKTLLDNTADIRKTMGENLGFETVSKLDLVFSENPAYKNKWINVNGAFLKTVGQTADLQKCWFVLYDGSMMYSLDKQSTEQIQEYADSVSELKECMSDDQQLFYIQLPFKINPDKSMPAGCKEYGNSNADELTSALVSKGVTVFDVRRTENYGIEKANLEFYETDHHWTARTAFHVAGQISEFIDKNDPDWLCDPETYDLDNYNIKTYQDWFLGSLGKKTGNVYAGIDDFELITPNYATDFDFVADAQKGIIKREGSFEEALLDKSNLKKDYFSINTYATYTGGDYKENIVTNKNTANKTKVLLVRDSFSCALMPFLALSTGELTTIDLRYYEKMSLREYLEENDFDIILIAYNPSAFSEKQFDFD